MAERFKIAFVHPAAFCEARINPINLNYFHVMGVNTGKNFREGEEKRRSQTYNPKTQEWVKRNTDTGKFVRVDKSGNPFKGVRKER